MEAVIGLLLFFLFAAFVIALIQIQETNLWPIARPAVRATWPMYPDPAALGPPSRLAEGFVGSSLEAATNSEPLGPQGINSPKLKAWLPAPETVTKGSVGACPRVLLDGKKYEAGIGKPFKSYDLLDDWMTPKPEPRVAGGPTAQKCYEVDWARGLERAGSYAQRTNNYQHGYPDSCSAPYHELILNYYEPKPTAGPYQV
jgi:hypothetical protein